MAELKTNIKTKFAKSYLESFKKQDNYLFLAKVDPWENESTNYIPASPNDNLFEENSAKKSIICAYKIYESDVALGIKRYDWTSGTKYSEYDDRLELDKNQLKYYVINQVESKYRVYKCLNNSNDGVSTDPPTGNGVEEEYKSDGYVWKFLYEIPEEMEKFITSDYVPVPIVDGLFYSDERSLQLDVQNNSKPGAIEEITFKYSENSVTPLAQEDVINPEFTNIACKILAKETDSTGNVFITISTSSLSDPIFLSTTNGYYNDDYVMVIRSGTEGDIVATIKNYLMNDTEENKAIIELCDIVGNAINIQIGSPYSILPRIQINGDGQESIAIPVFVAGELEDIELVALGENYAKAEAFFAIDTPYVLSPIISPIGGHGSEAYLELNAKNVLISKTLDKHTITSSASNRFFYGNGNNIHQFGIINSIKTIDGDVLDEEEPIDKVTLIKSDATVILTFNQYSNITGNSDNNAGFFNVNDILTKGSSFKKDQFRARIDTIVLDSDDKTTITCTLLNGLYENYPGMSLKNSTTGRTFVFTDSSDDEVDVSYENLPNQQIFNSADYLFGIQTLFTGKILETLENDSNFVSYKVEGIKTPPIVSKYDGAGNLIPGEKVTLLYNTTDNNVHVVEDANMNVLEIVSQDASINTCYSYLTKIKLNSRSIEFPNETIGSTSYIQQGDYIDKYIITNDLNNFGRIVHVEYENPVGVSGYENANVYVKREKGIFFAFASTQDRQIYTTSTSPYEKDYELTAINAYCSTDVPQYATNSSNLDINSGNVIYLENMRYITLNDDQSIKAQIVLEF